MAETSSPRVAWRPDDDTKVYLSVSKVRLWICSTREAFYVSSVACCPGCHGSVHRLSAFDSVGRSSHVNSCSKDIDIVRVVFDDRARGRAPSDMFLLASATAKSLDTGTGCLRDSPAPLQLSKAAISRLSCSSFSQHVARDCVDDIVKF